MQKPKHGMTLVRGYHPAVAELNKWRIYQRMIGARRQPKMNQGVIGFELTGRNPLTEETVDAIRSLLKSLGDERTEAIVETVIAGARLSFSERSPQRPIEHAFKPALEMDER